MKTKALLLVLPITVFLSGCTQEFSLKGADEKLAERSVTEEAMQVVFPDDNPSVPDGKAVYEKMNCAECHSATGQPVAGKASLDLSSKTFMGKRKPLDQFIFLSYGGGSAEGENINHPALKGKVSRRDIWDLVFYTRSLAVPALSDDEVAQIDAVFGSNCAVCHGKRGHGDGPLAKNLEPVPANFHKFERFYDRDDDMLWDHIANGIKWEGMPNFLNKQDSAKNVKFDEAYIRKLVQYIRHFHESNKPTLAQAATNGPR